MTSSDREPNRVPLRAGAMLLLAVAVVCIGLGWHSAVSGSDSGATELAAAGSESSSAAPTVSTTASSGAVDASTSGSASSTDPSAGAANADAPELCVLNAGSIAGLAQEVDDSLRAKGWRTSTPGNLRSASITENTVFYTSSQRAAAQRVAADLGGASADPRPSAFTECADGIAVVVVTR